MAFGIGLSIVSLPLLGKTYVNSEFLVGLLVAVRYLGISLFDIPAGLIMMRIGVNRAMLLGIAVIVLSSGLAILSGEIILLMFSRVIEGIGISLWLVSRQSYIALTVPNKSIGRSSSIFGGLFRIGLFLSPLVGGFIASDTSIIASWFEEPLEAVFYLQFLVTLGVLIFFFLGTYKQKRVYMPRDTWREMPKVLKNTIVQNRRSFIIIGFVTLSLQLIRAAREYLLPIQSDNIGLGTELSGVVVAASFFLDACIFPVSGLIMDRFGRKAAAIPAFTFLTIALVLLAFSNSTLSLIIAALVLGFGNGISSGLVVTWGADLAPREHTGEFIGVWRVPADFGSAAGPFTVGIIDGIGGLLSASLSVAALGVVSVAVVIFFVPETLRRHRGKRKWRPPPTKPS